MKSIRFVNFDRLDSGRLISCDGENAVVYHRNPYGGHSLVLLEWSSDYRKWVAYRHGDEATLVMLSWISRHVFRRAVKFLAKKKPEKLRRIMNEGGEEIERLPVGVDSIPYYHPPVSEPAVSEPAVSKPAWMRRITVRRIDGTVYQIGGVRESLPKRLLRKVLGLLGMTAQRSGLRA